jgi:hypothetical protein
MGIPKVAGETLFSLQHGGVQTPTASSFASFRLWWKYRGLLRILSRSDVLLSSTKVGRGKTAVSRLMGELTSASRKEVGLLRTDRGRVLRLGVTGRLDVKGAVRVIAHTHTNGMIGLSADDYLSIFLNPVRRHRSTIIVGPSGLWRRYDSKQSILGGNF